MIAYFPTVIGSERLKKTIAEEILSGRFPHACILEAPAGAGKYSFARSVAAALACTRREDRTASLPCGTCDSCRRILSGNCIDVLTFGTEGGASVKIQTIRRLKENVILSPSELSVKVYIIRDADKMTAEAQNALLKMLEEPPVPGTYYFLLSENAEALLPTVRSRAPVFRLSPPSRDQVAHLMQETGRYPDRISVLRASAAAHNSAELTQAVLDGTEEGKKLLSNYETAERALTLLAGNGSKADFILFFTGLNLQKAEASSIFRLIYSGLRDIITVKRSAKVAPDFFAETENVQRISGGFTLRTALKVSEAVEDSLSSLEKNTAPKTVLLAFGVKAYNAMRSR